ncbi:hypothetical protein MMC10_003241 [Thelotrema lepadinum]|nr:hypothetical protein [Thelotrema lepadinum]
MRSTLSLAALLPLISLALAQYPNALYSRSPSPYGSSPTLYSRDAPNALPLSLLPRKIALQCSGSDVLCDGTPGTETYCHCKPSSQNQPKLQAAPKALSRRDTFDSPLARRKIALRCSGSDVICDGSKGSENMCHCKPGSERGAGGSGPVGGNNLAGGGPSGGPSGAGGSGGPTSPGFGSMGGMNGVGGMPGGVGGMPGGIGGGVGGGFGGPNPFTPRIGTTMNPGGSSGGVQPLNV